MRRPRWRRVICLFALLVLLTMTRLPAADPAYQLRVVTDRKDAIYEAGTEAKFLITVSKGDETVPNAAVKFVVDDFLKSGEAAGLPVGSVTTTDQSAVVTVTGKQPGFLQCHV